MRAPAHSDRREDPPSRAKRENQCDRREHRSRERSDRATRSREPEGRTVRSTKKELARCGPRSLGSRRRASLRSGRAKRGGKIQAKPGSLLFAGGNQCDRREHLEAGRPTGRTVRYEQRKESKHSRAGVREGAREEFAEGQLVRNLGQKRRLGRSDPPGSSVRSQRQIQLSSTANPPKNPKIS